MASHLRVTDPELQLRSLQSRKQALKPPTKLAAALLGKDKAAKWQQSKADKKAQAIERAHDGWLRLGVDTREIQKQGGKLPPSFLNPPPADMEERLRAMGV